MKITRQIIGAVSINILALAILYGIIELLARLSQLIK